MNLFDRISEDLTDMMVDIMDHPDTRVGVLMKRLEACHTQACNLSRDLRQEAAQAAAESDRRRSAA